MQRAGLALMKAKTCVLLAAALTNSCGLRVPEIEPLKTSPRATAFLVNTVANQVNCELRKAVQQVVRDYTQMQWLKTWSAKVTYKIVVDEKSSFNPGVSLNTPFANNVRTFGDKSTVTTPQSFALGIGGQFSSDATRTESIGFFFQFSDFFPPPGPRAKPCPSGEGAFIKSDLKLLEWLEGAALTAETPGTIGLPFASGAPYDTITHEVQFVVVSGLNATPTWRLVSITANPTSPFLGATRTRTDDVLITMGPIGELKNGRAVRPSISVENAHLAAEIGQAISSNIQSHQ